MKTIPVFLPVFFICILFVFALPHLVRLRREENMPVSVTSLGAAGVAVAEPQEPALGIGEDLNGYAGLDDFAAPLLNGRAGQVIGVYVPGLFALPVRQQPAGQPDFVDRDNDVLTEFSLPRKYGSTGLLAHNYLSGSRFFGLQENQDIVLVYGDGHTDHFRVAKITSFQALKPNSPFSDFVDLSNPGGSHLTSAQLFSRIYTSAHQLVFQTCIESEGEPSWGRIFITATQVEPLNLTVPPLYPFDNNN